MRPGDRRVRSCALGPFTFTLGLVRVRSVHSRRHWVIVACVWSIPSRPGGDRDRSRAFCPFPCAFGFIGCVQSINIYPVGRRLRSDAFGPFPYALGVIGFVPVRRRGRRVRWCTFGPFPCALGVILFDRVRSVQSRAFLRSE